MTELLAKAYLGEDVSVECSLRLRADRILQILNQFSSDEMVDRIVYI